MIEISNLTFSYHRKAVLDDLNLNIEEGSFNLFYGLNGSGKTTTIKLILGFLNDKRIKRNYKTVAYMPEKTVLPDYITVGEYLRDLAYLGHTVDYNRYLEAFNLSEKQMIYTLSKGNKQKVSLIQLLMMNVDLYILDEPTNGLDQESINILLNILKGMRKKTIIIVTHYKKLFARWKIKRYAFEDGKVQEIS